MGASPSADNEQSQPPDRRPAQPSSAARRVARARRRKTSGRRLFAFDREFGCRYIAGADEAGRGSLAGPLVAAAVLFDLERLTLSDRRALSRLNDSKQHTAETREELYPLVLRAAARSVIVSRCVRGIDGRGLLGRPPGGWRLLVVGARRSPHLAAIIGRRAAEVGRRSARGCRFAWAASRSQRPGR